MSLSLLLLTASAKAQDDDDAPPEPAEEPPKDAPPIPMKDLEKRETEAFHVNLAVVASGGRLHRSATTPRDVGGYTGGIDLRIHPRSRHGFVASYTFAETIFGPRVHIVDAGYSYRLAGDVARGGTGAAVYVEAAPALGFVKDAPPGQDHTVLGLRMSASADVYLWILSVGMQVGYRAGMPLSGTRAAWEGAAMLGLRAGIALDFD